MTLTSIFSFVEIDYLHISRVLHNFPSYVWQRIFDKSPKRVCVCECLCVNAIFARVFSK
jgi:hypothetical protein